MASHGISRGSGPVVRSEEARQKELQQIETYKDLSDLVNSKVAERQYTAETLAFVTKLLNENPEYYTVWNHRRRVLIALVAEDGQSQDDLLQNDLQLTFALLRKFPKCYWIWNHRDWLLQKAESLLGADAAHKLWTGELQLVSKMLHADSRNFHAWSYRRIVVSKIERLAATNDALQAAPSLAQPEFDYTTKMIKSNLSNFSAWHNRSQLIPRILSERNADAEARRAFMASELELICEAINTDPFDQSIWFYHQYLMSTISPSSPPERLIIQDLTNGERQKFYENEMEYIKEILEDETDCKWIYEGLLGLAEAYLEVDAGTGAVTTKDMRSWLTELKRLDALRRGRWEDLETRLQL
ncbi:Rab geranylgeranyltransferase [Curvularia kusanoi]|uniref:Geranylgeranyl transferase type-2 subunit alpha n=1 Tax=Curvularia kusanoi TaxID=90978 RepID=A0A9P4WDY9_CURKU|nr:Rab geranylgeranyltransferase [Curvularia kusanoi]